MSTPRPVHVIVRPDGSEIVHSADRGDPIELICEGCGVGNPEGTEFCLFCGTYLAWDRSVLVKPDQRRPGGPVGAQPGQAPVNPVRPTYPAAGPQPQGGGAFLGSGNGGSSGTSGGAAYGTAPGAGYPGSGGGPQTGGQAAFGAVGPGSGSGAPPASAGTPAYPTSAGSPAWNTQPTQPVAGAYPTGGGDPPPWVVAAQLKNPPPRQAPPPQQTYVDEAATVPHLQASPVTAPMPVVPANPAFGQQQTVREPMYSGQQAGYGVANQQPPGGAVPGGPCPRCQTVNDPSRRFCSKCGYVLIADNTVGANVPFRPPRPQGWWARMSDSHDRAARRAYRRSLPPLYRWRRIIVMILLSTVGLGALYSVLLLKNQAMTHPIRFAQQRWDDLRNNLVDVGPLRVRIDPKTATVAGSDPNALIDKTVQGWTESWQPQAQGESCGGAPGTGTIVINIPQPTRIRQIEITAGLSDQDPNRALQARPKAIGIILNENSADCRRFVLQDIAGTQVLKLDSVTTVAQLRIGIDTTYAEPADGQHVLSIAEIAVKARPRH